MCLHHLLILCILIRVFNCLSTFSLKYTQIFKIVKTWKIGKTWISPPKFQNPEKTVKMLNYTPQYWTRIGTADCAAYSATYMNTVQSKWRCELYTACVHCTSGSRPVAVQDGPTPVPDRFLSGSRPAVHQFPTVPDSLHAVQISKLLGSSKPAMDQVRLKQLHTGSSAVFFSHQFLTGSKAVVHRFLSGYLRLYVLVENAIRKIS